MRSMHNNGMSASQRRAQILDLLSHGPIPTQQDLGDRLAAMGIPATQTTISRDLAAIGAVKTSLGYQLPSAGGPPPSTAADGVTNVVVSAEVGGTMLVVRTPPAHANPVAQRIDALDDPDVLGSIAGDDTVFVAVRSAAAAQRLSTTLFPSPALQRGA